MKKIAFLELSVIAVVPGQIESLLGRIGLVTRVYLMLIIGFLCVSQLSYKALEEYGPKTYAPALNKRYDFSKVSSTFGPFKLKRLKEFTAPELESVILESIPRTLRQRASHYVAKAVSLAERYQVDPFWVLAVMWTESHFNPKAKSAVHAIGLMQIMPGTSHYLFHKMKRPLGVRLAYKLAKDPDMNMKMGVFYLNYLLRKFSGNSSLATVAYNMGPNRVFKRLRLGLPTGIRNQYLNKVKRNYFALTKSIQKSLSSRGPSITTNRVVFHSQY